MRSRLYAVTALCAAIALVAVGPVEASSEHSSASGSVVERSADASHAPTAVSATSLVAHAAVARLAKPTKATLVLDYLPNAVHAGIYRAVAAGYYKADNLDLRIVQPTSTADTLRLIDAGKADFGLADGSDVAGQIAAGRDAQAIMAVAQRPLGGLIALAKTKLTSPKELEGKRVGVTGVPSDEAVLDTIVKSASGNPAKVKTVTIGFNGVPDLENGKITAFTGFWPADGVQVSTDGDPITVFRLDEHGGPGYPGLVAFSTRRSIAKSPALMRAFVDATVHGYEDTLADPTRSLNDLLSLNKALKRPFTKASLQAYLPLFQSNAPRFGVLRDARIRAMSSWMLANRLIKKAVTPARYGTNRFLPAR